MHFSGIKFFDCTCDVDIMKISSFVDFELYFSHLYWFLFRYCTCAVSLIVKHLSLVPTLKASVTIETILNSPPCSKSLSHIAENT